MSWYPCCCDQGNKAYVPCCLYGIQAILEVKSNGGNIRLNKIELTHLKAGMTSVNHWSPISIPINVWTPYAVGGLWWYHWGLLPITSEHLFLPNPGGNWRLNIQFKNVSADYDQLNEEQIPTSIEIRKLHLDFSFWGSSVKPDYQQIIELYPTSVTGTGWTNLAGLAGDLGADPPAESDLLSTCEASGLITATFGEIDWHDARHVIDDIARPYRAYKFVNPLSGDPLDDKHLCFKSLTTTQDPTDNNLEPLDVDCEDAVCYPLCTCEDSRPADPNTCQTCYCTSHFPIKLGSYGSNFPEPVVHTWTQFNPGQEWTVRGFAKSLQGGPDWQVLFWNGNECHNVPSTADANNALVLHKSNMLGDEGWYLKLHPIIGQTAIIVKIDDTTTQDVWFFWWIRQKKIGSQYYITFRVGNEDNRSDPTKEIILLAPFTKGDLTILGEHGEGFSFENKATFAGCIDGLTFTPQAETDQFLDNIQTQGCTIPPSA